MSEFSSQRQPHNPKAEQAVLGAVLKVRDLMIEVAQKLKPDDFYIERHRLIFRSMLALSEDAKDIDVVTLCEHLSANGVIDQAGGPEYVSRLIDEVPSSVRHEHYGDIVRDKATRRRLIAAANDSILRARDEASGIEETADSVAQSFLDLATGAAKEHTRPMREIVGDVIDQVEKLAKRSAVNGITGVPSGYFALDKITAGWQPSDLVVLAARPGMGKTAFALELLKNATRMKRDSKAMLFFSLEMSSQQLATRVISSHTKVPLSALRLGALSRAQHDKLFRGADEIGSLPIYIHDRSPMTVTEIARISRKVHHEHPLGMIIIDYLQLMQGSDAKKNQNREQEISEISRKLKSLAKDLQVPVIALSQLNRSVEKRPGKKPILSDLRESGAIEQDADIIIFLFRQAYYDALEAKEQGNDDASIERERRARGGAGDETQVIIAKHRSGETGNISILYIPECTAFANYATDTPPPDDDDIAPDAARFGGINRASDANESSQFRSPTPEPDGTRPPPGSHPTAPSGAPNPNAKIERRSTGTSSDPLGDILDDSMDQFVEMAEDDDDIPY